MRKVTFQVEMNGKTRFATPKEKVNGYKRSNEYYGLTIFRRGNIGFIVDNGTKDVTLEKFNYRACKYEDVTYDDFRKFVDIHW